MSDLEITKLCAEAMGWECRLYDGPSGSNRHYRVYENGAQIYGIGEDWITSKWKPLHDDAQAMALVKKLKLNIGMLEVGCKVFKITNDYVLDSDGGSDLNRAICECVAKMRLAKVAT